MATKNRKNRSTRPGPQRGHRRAGGFPISLVMIARDEAAVIGRCLESVQGLVDEIVVVDTGSVDDTVAIAESFGAKVTHFAWIDDFAAARNFALAQATHPWRLVLDADEWIADREQAAETLAFIRTQVPSFVGRLEMLQLNEHTGELQDTVTFPIPRLLPRQVSYVGRVHEQPDTDLPMPSVPVLLGHDGYTSANNARKDGRNIALLEKALAEEPENPYYWFQLGTDHYSHERYEQALPYFVQAYNILHPLDPAQTKHLLAPWWHLLTIKLMLTLIVLKDYERAIALGQQEGETWIDSSEFFYALGTALEGRCRQLIDTDPVQADELLSSALGCWIHAVDQGDVRQYSGSLVERGTVLAARALAVTYERLERPNDAAKYRAISDPVAVPA